MGPSDSISTITYAISKSPNEQDRIRRARAWRIRSVGLNRWVQRASGCTWELNATAGAARCAAWRAWVVRVACRCAEGDARTMAEGSTGVNTRVYGERTRRGCIRGSMIVESRDANTGRVTAADG